MKSPESSTKPKKPESIARIARTVAVRAKATVRSFATHLDHLARSAAERIIAIGWPLVVRCVNGHSMVPVLPPGTYVLGNRWFRKLKREDVVIFIHDGKEKIKRISEIDGDKLYVIGDHEETSTDSRHFGWVDRGTVIARVKWPKTDKADAEEVQASPDK
jgi:nickel-type superoxide dismutase maturation protease